MKCDFSCSIKSRFHQIKNHFPSQTFHKDENAGKRNEKNSLERLMKNIICQISEHKVLAKLCSGKMNEKFNTKKKTRRKTPEIKQCTKHSSVYSVLFQKSLWKCLCVCVSFVYVQCLNVYIKFLKGYFTNFLCHI